MRRHVTIFGTRLDLALVLLLIIASVTLSHQTDPRAAIAQPSAVQPEPAAREARPVVGTVRAVDPKAHTIEVITGVGHAFRLVRVEIAPDAEIRDRGAPSGLADIQRGRIVRIQYMTAAPLRLQPVVISIDALAKEETGGVR